MKYMEFIKGEVGAREVTAFGGLAILTIGVTILLGPAVALVVSGTILFALGVRG